jgi:glutathione S-transferase
MSATCARWALEEAGIPYAVRKLDAAAERPADYFEEQPFGQVPSYRDDTVSLFESGAIVLHVGRNSEALLPANPAAQARATAWLIAALGHPQAGRAPPRRDDSDR